MDAALERLFLIHYHEVGLKGKNRSRFENQLLRNIEQALKGLPRGAVLRIDGAFSGDGVATCPGGTVTGVSSPPTHTALRRGDAACAD